MKLTLQTLLLFFTISAFSQNVNITTKINGFRHNWDCCNDGVAVGCIIGNYPEPRFKVWVGYNATTFSQSTNGPGLYCGSSNYTYGVDAKTCNTWNPGQITGPSFSNVAATSLNVDMQSWEEDESGTPNVWPFNGCPHDDCNPNSDTWCANDDDVRCGRLRIGDIDFSVYQPCVEKVYTGAFSSGSFLSMHGRCTDDGGDYGIDEFKVTWNFAAAPTVVKHPSDASYGGAIRDVCTGLPITINVISNKFGTGNWTLSRWVKWQSSPDGTTWSDIAGTLNGTAYSTATTFSYTFTPVTAGTIYYRAVLSSLCTSGFASQTTNSNAVRFIIHDAATDPFCTAPSCDIIYVDPTSGGSDISGDGKPSNPYKTISKAVTSNPIYIRVAKGLGTDANIVNIPTNCIIEGGYVRTGSSGERWTKSSASTDKTIITFSGSEASNANSRHVVAFKSDAKSGWAVKDIDIITANTPASTYASSGRGMSNYGFLIINGSSNYTISRVDIAVGNAGNGDNGTTPSGSGGAGGRGSGGSGGGGSSGGNTPGAGTNGTQGSGTSGGGAGIRGSSTGSSGSGCFACACGCNRQGGGQDGGNGGAATAAVTSWTVGDRPTAVAPSNIAYYIPGGTTSGSNGFGGGGGGGGQGARGGRLSCGNCSGGDGGDGGDGGAGGLAGSGGFGGGGAFGIWRFNASTGATLEQINLSSSGTAGTGGTGAAGQAADNTGRLPGSKGGSGVCVANACNADPGDGGTGGAGSAGGRGRDGANGTTAQMVTNGTATTLTATIPYFSTVTLDNFSQRNNISGKMCNNSEIDMTKTSGTWALPAGLSFVNDKTSSTTSYLTSSASVKVTTNSTDAFYDISNGTLLKNFLYTATDDRSLPAIVKSSTYICKGSTMDLSANNNFDVANIQEYDYVVYLDGSTALTPYSGGTFNSTAANYTTPVFNTAGKYWVRYRERHNCCGWSRPVYTSFDVIDTPNAPAAISISGGPYCFDGTGKSFTITLPGSTFAFPAYDSWELFDEDPAFGTPTPIGTYTSVTPSMSVSPTQTTTYYVRGKNACGESTTLNVTAYISGDAVTTGVLATATSTKTCVVNDALWHYFRNSTGQIIAAINSNGQNLGNVTMTVTIQTTTHDVTYYSPKHGNGGLGRDGSCFGQPELSMRRWYTITPTNQPSAGHPSSLKLFFTSGDYTNYSSEIGSWTTAFASNYAVCYGFTTGATDLVVSKDESYDIIPTAASAAGGPNSSTQYDLSVPSFSTFRFHTFGNVGQPLPVELMSFTGWNDGAVNNLQWITASEKNTERFEIQRSVNRGNWEVIGALPASGNSSLPLTYNFVDNNPSVGNNYYRLNIIDYDFSSSLSNTINIPIGTALTNGFIGVYPNPTDGLLNVDLQSTSSYGTKLIVYDIIGKKTYEKYSQINKGMNTIQLDFSTLAKGTYILQFADEIGKIHTTKFVKD